MLRLKWPLLIECSFTCNPPPPSLSIVVAITFSLLDLFLPSLLFLSGSTRSCKSRNSSAATRLDFRHDFDQMPPLSFILTGDPWKKVSLFFSSIFRLSFVQNVIRPHRICISVTNWICRSKLEIQHTSSNATVQLPLSLLSVRFHWTCCYWPGSVDLVCWSCSHLLVFFWT